MEHIELIQSPCLWPYSRLPLKICFWLHPFGIFKNLPETPGLCQWLEYYNSFLFLRIFPPMLEIEPRAWHMSGKHSTIEVHSWPRKKKLKGVLFQPNFLFKQWKSYAMVCLGQMFNNSVLLKKYAMHISKWWSFSIKRVSWFHTVDSRDNIQYPDSQWRLSS